MGGLRVVTVLAMVLLAGCAPRPSAMRAAPDPTATIQTIHVATGLVLDQTGSQFGIERKSGLRYFRADISVPPTHMPGQIEWPEGKPDAATDFVVTGTEVLENATQLITRMRAGSPGRETLLYVHGYNNTLSEAMYRLAQIRTDFETTMPALLFSWPSAGDPRGYVYDRDSVLFARDDLVALIERLTTGPGDRVFVLAHSMGSQLVMEALRQIALSGDRTALSRLSGVVLMSPDIDPDVFARQAEAIGRLPQPFFIFITRADRALSLSGFITGRKPRLGVIDAAEEVTRPDVQVIDFSALATGEAYNHFVPVTSPAAIEILNRFLSETGRPAAGALGAMTLKLPAPNAVPRESILLKSGSRF
ncbi:esterase/lipase superfamily enzyme [Roseovarius sp. MBR-78]|uniref:alpha/beta hydrolase n=1 Tax=Roseovarius sp. MBR-78 TaxID=3156460 RepID=UPI0033912B08